MSVFVGNIRGINWLSKQTTRNPFLRIKFVEVVDLKREYPWFLVGGGGGREGMGIGLNLQLLVT